VKSNPPILRIEAFVSEADIEAIERAGEALIRAGAIHTAIEVLALALRLRSETGLHPERRSSDAVT